MISKASMRALIAFAEARIAEDEATVAPHLGERWADSVAAGNRERRTILERHAPVVDGTQSTWAWFQGSESESERALRLLATTWDEYPDYRREWLPTR